MPNVRLSWAEARQQEAELQQLMLDAMMMDLPEFGILVVTPDPDTFISTISRARDKDPLLQKVEIRMTGEGVAICVDPKRSMENEPQD